MKILRIGLWKEIGKIAHFVYLYFFWRYILLNKFAAVHFQYLETDLRNEFLISQLIFQFYFLLILFINMNSHMLEFPFLINFILHGPVCIDKLEKLCPMSIGWLLLALFSSINWCPLLGYCRTKDCLLNYKWLIGHVMEFRTDEDSMTFGSAVFALETVPFLVDIGDFIIETKVKLFIFLTLFKYFKKVIIF